MEKPQKLSCPKVFSPYISNFYHRDTAEFLEIIYQVHEISPGKKCWNGLPLPSPGDPPDPGIEPVSPALAGRFFPGGCHLGSLS